MPKPDTSDHEVESLQSVELKVQLIPSKRSLPFSYAKETEDHGQKRRLRWTYFQKMNVNFKTQRLDTHDKEATLRKGDKASSGVTFWMPLCSCCWEGVSAASCPIGLQSTAGLHSSLRKHPRHLHIPPGAGKAAAALKLQPSSYWHEKENRARRGKGRGREGEKEEEGRDGGT